MNITFLYYEDCPSHEDAMQRLRDVMSDISIEAEIDVIKVETDEQAHLLRFVGSPTIRIDGEDIDPPGTDQPYALTCRVYTHEDGRFSPLPSPETIRRALLKHA